MILIHYIFGTFEKIYILNISVLQINQINELNSISLDYHISLIYLQSILNNLNLLNRAHLFCHSHHGLSISNDCLKKSGLKREINPFKCRQSRMPPIVFLLTPLVALVNGSGTFCYSSSLERLLRQVTCCQC